MKVVMGRLCYISPPSTPQVFKMSSHEHFPSVDLIFEGAPRISDIGSGIGSGIFDTTISSEADHTREWSIGELAILSNERSFSTTFSGLTSSRSPEEEEDTLCYTPTSTQPQTGGSVSPIQDNQLPPAGCSSQPQLAFGSPFQSPIVSGAGESVHTPWSGGWFLGARLTDLSPIPKPQLSRSSTPSPTTQSPRVQQRLFRTPRRDRSIQYSAGSIARHFSTQQQPCSQHCPHAVPTTAAASTSLCRDRVLSPTVSASASTSTSEVEFSVEETPMLRAADMRLPVKHAASMRSAPSTNSADSSPTSFNLHNDPYKNPTCSPKSSSRLSRSTPFKALAEIYKPRSPQHRTATLFLESRLSKLS